MTARARNVTIAVDEELFKRMKNDYPEVNWSEVGRVAFTKYMDNRIIKLEEMNLLDIELMRL